MKYRRLRKYKYQLTEDLLVNIGQPADGQRWPDASHAGMVHLSDWGYILLSAGYAWNGMTMWFDSRKSKRASAVHDGLCQLIAEGKLPRSYRKAADMVLYRLCREDGMSQAWATLVYWGARAGAALGVGMRRAEVAV